MTAFNGFDNDAFSFLRDVHQNNSKEWFEEHRGVYEDKLLTPFRALVESLSMPMHQIDEMIETRPVIGKTISHLRRDTRFSHDKSMYRSNMWFTFKRPKKNWIDAPAYFFEFGPDWWHYGLGYYSASPTTMGGFRERLKELPQEFLQAVKAIPEGFDIHSKNYKRQVFPETMTPELAAWYVRKSFYIASRSIDMTSLSSRRLSSMILEGFEKLSGVYWFLVNVERMKQEQIHGHGARRGVLPPR